MRQTTRNPSSRIKPFILAVAILQALMASCATRESPIPGNRVTPQKSDELPKTIGTAEPADQSKPVSEYREEDYRERLRDLLRRYDQGDDTGPIALVSRDEELQKQIQYFRDHRMEGSPVIESIVRIPPVVPDLSVATGVPRERYQQFMRGSLFTCHPDAEAFVRTLAGSEPALKLLCEYDEKQWLFTRACIVAGEVGYAWMSVYLYRALGHEDPGVFCVAAEGLAKMGERRAAPVCLMLAESEKDATYLVRLIGVLGVLGEEEQVPRIQALQVRDDRDGDVRSAIAKAVILIGARAKDRTRRREAE